MTRNDREPELILKELRRTNRQLAGSFLFLGYVVLMSLCVIVVVVLTIAVVTASGRMDRQTSSLMIVALLLSGGFTLWLKVGVSVHDVPSLLIKRRSFESELIELTVGDALPALLVKRNYVNRSIRWIMLRSRIVRGLGAFFLPAAITLLVLSLASMGATNLSSLVGGFKIVPFVVVVAIFTVATYIRFPYSPSDRLRTLQVRRDQFDHLIARKQFQTSETQS